MLHIHIVAGEIISPFYEGTSFPFHIYTNSRFSIVHLFRTEAASVPVLIGHCPHFNVLTIKGSNIRIGSNSGIRLVPTRKMPSANSRCSRRRCICSFCNRLRVQQRRSVLAVETHGVLRCRVVVLEVSSEAKDFVADCRHVQVCQTVVRRRIPRSPTEEDSVLFRRVCGHCDTTSARHYFAIVAVQFAEALGGKVELFGITVAIDTVENNEFLCRSDI